MAGQKVQTSILRRVLDNSPLRPARLENFQPQALKAAQFAARYFNRESSVIQRILNIGDSFSPIRRTIGRGVVSRYTAFNNSFGPVQRALRHQPEHQPRRRQSQIEDGFEAYESFETEDFGYSPEPSYFTPSEPPITQSYQADYASPAPAALPWETPLSSAPLPVARRIEFQPANLQYLRNPESPQPTRTFTERPAEPVVERRVAPVFREPVQEPAQAPDQPDRGAVSAAQPEINAAVSTVQTGLTGAEIPARPGIASTESPVQPGLTSSEALAQTGITGQVSTNQPGISPAPFTPPGETFRADSGAVERVTEFGETGFIPEPGGYAAVPVQPALSRALQRTYEATSYQPGLSTPAFRQGANQGNVLGASPAAVARHFAVPETLARYRSVKQAADKALYGETALEPVSTQGYAPEPAFSPLPLTYYQRTAQPAATPSYEEEPATADFIEVRRTFEASQPLPETPSYPVAPVNRPAPAPVQQPSQAADAPIPQTPAQSQPIQPAPGQRTTETVSPSQPAIETPAPAQRASETSPMAQPGNQTPPTAQWASEVPGNLPSAAIESPPSQQPAQPPVQRAEAVVSSQAPVSPDAVAATEPQPQRVAQPGGQLAGQPGGQPVSGRAALSAGEAAIERTFRPGRVSGLTGFAAEPVPFDEAIPASLLENTAAPSEVRRFSGARGDFPMATRTWANNLATLRNNPGVEARTSLPLARQLSEPASPVSQPGVEAWSGGGAGVYYDRRRPRRTDTAMAADADAAETQDRIFSLTEPNSAVSSFQPQFMQALAAEAVTPAQPAPVINRTIQVAPQNQTTAQAVPVRPGDSPAPGVNREAQTTVYREIRAAGPESGIAQARPGQPSTQPGQNLESAAPANQLSRSPEAAPAGEVERVANEQAAPAENAAYPSDSPARSTQAAQAANAPEIAGQPLAEASVSGPTVSEAPATGPTVSETGEVDQTALEAAQPGQSFAGGAVSSQVLPETEPGISSRTFAEVEGVGESPRTIRSAGPQPTALQRAFKRLDLAEPGAGPAFGGATSPDFNAASFSYTVRPGAYPRRPGQPDDSAAYIEFDEGASGGFPEAAYPATQPSQPPVRETVVERVSQPQEPAPARPYSETNAASPVQDGIDTVARVAAQAQPTSTGPDVAQVAGETGFEGLPASTPSGAIPRTQAVTGADAPGAVEVVRLSQPQYFANSLETAWLTPENRLMVERLPGGSGALQRLRQAPGQLSAFLDQFRATSTPGMNLSSLSNNPGLSASVARTFENTGPASSSSPAVNNWAGSQPLSFALRRRPTRQTSEGVVEYESDSGAGQGDYFGFEQGPAQFSPAAPAYDSPVQSRSEVTQPEVARTFNAPANQNQPAPVQRVTGQPVSFQNNANRETAARIQRNGVADPTQPASNPSFTITSDWVAQLQRRFAGFSVGQLSEATGQVMRFLNNEGGSLPGSAFGGNAGADFGSYSSFSYAVPPLLWRKVTDYAPHNALPLNPAQTAGGQPAFTYTSPGEVLRAYEEGQTYPGLPDEGAIAAEPAEAANQARLELPRLEQTHRLLQRIASLENTNQSLELAHRMEAAAQASNFVTPTSPVNPAQPGQLPLSLPRPVTVQRQPDLAGGAPTPIRFSSDLEAAEAAEAAEERFTPAPLRMTDVPVNRPGLAGRSEEAEAGSFTEDDFAQPAPEIQTVEVRVPERQNYATPLEAAAARSGPNGPNIGQGEILQPLAIQRKAAASGPAQTATYAPLAQPTLHNVIKTSVGRTLDTQVQRTMTGIFGSHFQDVRVHTGDEAAQATRQVGAEAFTLGSNIYFAPGRYQPDTQAGQALIGHELTHVIQQSSLPSLGGGRIPETSSMGQTLEHHAIANEQLLLRHLSNNHDDHQHGFSSDDSGRLSYQNNYSSSSYSGGTATVERSYQPVSEQNSHPPVNQTHLHSASGSSIQRTGEENSNANQNPPATSGGNTNVDDIIKNQESMERMARRVYQIMRDQLLIERDRGFGPGNGKFF